jgi:hypothetical protein
MHWRDTKPQIFYIGHGDFSAEPWIRCEAEPEALKRELVEQMDFEAVRLDDSGCLNFDLSAIGAGKVFRAVYEVPVSEWELGAYNLRDGRECKAFTPSDILLNLRVTPYDALAVWLDYARKRFRLAIPDAAGRVP